MPASPAPDPPRDGERDRAAPRRGGGAPRLLAVNAPDGPATQGGYSQAIRLAGATDLLFVSGQIPVDSEGTVPQSFADQCRLVWRNVEAQLRAGGFGLADIVKVTTFLAHREDAEENSGIRRDVLGDHAPALTVVIATIYDPAWLLEIEVVAAKGVS